MRVEPLPGVERIALPAAVALADVELAVGPEGDHAAVVVVVGLRDVHQHLGGLRRLLGRERVRALRIDGEADDERSAVERQRGVVDEEVAVLLELRMEGDRPQALLDEAGLHVGAERVDVGEVEERLGVGLAAFHDLDAADALDDEDASRAVVRDRYADGVVETRPPPSRARPSARRRSCRRAGRPRTRSPGLSGRVRARRKAPSPQPSRQAIWLSSAYLPFFRPSGLPETACHGSGGRSEVGPHPRPAPTRLGSGVHANARDLR